MAPRPDGKTVQVIRQRVFGPAAFACLVVAAGIVLLREWPEQSRVVAPLDELPSGIRVVDHVFADEAQAGEYRAAMADGNLRSLDVLASALRQAEAQSPPNEATVRRLKAEISRRQTLLGTLRQTQRPQ